MGFALSEPMTKEFCSSGKLQPFVVEVMKGDKTTAREEGVSK
jgi:hypothetical protein